MSASLELVALHVADRDAIQTFHLTHHVSLNNKFRQVRARVSPIKPPHSNSLLAFRKVRLRHGRINLRVFSGIKLELIRKPMKNTLVFPSKMDQRKNRFQWITHPPGSLGNVPGPVFLCTCKNKIDR